MDKTSTPPTSQLDDTKRKPCTNCPNAAPGDQRPEPRRIQRSVGNQGLQRILQRNGNTRGRSPLERLASNFPALRPLPRVLAVESPSAAAALSHPSAMDARTRLVRQMQRQQGNAAVQRAINRAHSGIATDEAVQQALADTSGGQPLDPSTRSGMEQALGHELGGVRVHTDIHAAGLSQALQANAFTRGRDIYFADGAFQPETREGKQLLAHELLHTLQAPAPVAAQRSTGDPTLSQPSDRAEVEAETIAAQLVWGLPTGLPHYTAPTIARQTLENPPVSSTTTATPTPATATQTANPSSPGPSPATVPPETARRLAYAATVLRRTPRLTSAEERRLNQIIQDTPIYQWIQQRNAKRVQIESDQQWLTDYQNRNAAIARGETLAGGTGASQDVLDRLSDEIATLTPQVEQLNADIQVNLARLNIGSEEELIRIVEVEFPQKWIARAKQIASAMLDENKDAVQREKERYAANICSPDFNGLREADRGLKDLSDQVIQQEDRIRIVEGEASREAPSGGIPDPSQLSSSHYDIVRLPQMRDELERRRSVLRTARQSYGTQYKVLLLDNYSPGAFMNQSDDALANLTGRWLQEILDNIETTRDNINQEKIKVWNLRDVPELTYQSLGIEPNSVLGTAVNRYIQGQVSDEQALQIALAVLQIGAVIVATIAAGPLGGAIVGGALTLNQLMMDVDRYLVESAASHVALDPTIADISLNEPELLPIIIDIVSLGLDAASVVAALRPAARLMVATGEVSEYANQVRRVAPEAADQLIARAERRAASGVLQAEPTAEAAAAAQRAEREIITGTAEKTTGQQLTARELQTELDVVGRSPRRTIAEGEYIAEVDLGNGHRWRMTRDGRWCRFSNGLYCVTHLAFGGEGAALDQTLRLGPRTVRPTADELSGALGRLRAGTLTSADQEILLRQTIADTRAYIQAKEGRPLSWDVVKGRCGAGRDLSAASFGALTADSPRPLSIFRFQSKEVFGVNKHGFNVVTFADGSQYLVDPTFGQFLRPTGQATRDVAATAEVLTSSPDGLALTRSLTENGFVPLTPENVRLYARGLGVAEPDAQRLGSRLFRGENATLRESVGQGRQSVYRVPASGPDVIDRSEAIRWLGQQIADLQRAGDPNGLLPQLQDLLRNLERLPTRR